VSAPYSFIYLGDGHGLTAESFHRDSLIFTPGIQICVNVCEHLVYSKGVRRLTLLCISTIDLFIFRECDHDTGSIRLIFTDFFSVIREKCWHGTLNSHQLLPSKSFQFIHYCSILVPYNLRYSIIN